MNSSWIPAGDDDRGSGVWLWKSQEYDWKGRVTREVNTDGTDRLISYEGCGCAGGQITTVSGELVPRDDQPTVNARRTQKIYADILARTYKTEILKWDASTVYSTTVQTFNGRDQVTKTRQYAGTDTSSTYQDVDMTYDGVGRMKTRHYPIEDPGTYTEWIYNDDDSVDQIIDPREVITEFTYNDPRGLLTKVAYQPPTGSGILPVADVVYAYDYLGNRTSMTDGTGNTTYSYNDQSQLTSESKYFDDLPNAPVTNNQYTVSYTYNLAGGLKSVTDPFGYEVIYSHDKTGRLLKVDGDTTANNPTGKYVKGIEYRAFGAIKNLDYDMPSEVAEIKMEFDARLRVDHSEVISPSESGGYLLKANYSYAADSRVSGRDDQINNHLDQTSKYDFAGRLVFNQFGMVQNNQNQSVRTYEQTIGYDSFSMMTSRNGEHWGETIGFAETYVNGRIQNQSGLIYDAAGNIVATGATVSPHDSSETGIDAAGRRSGMLSSTKGRWGSMLNMVTEKKTVVEYDGDGHAVKEAEGSQYYHAVNDPPPSGPPAVSVTAFQVWSTVLGQAITRLIPNGSKWETAITAGGSTIATDDVQTGILRWKAVDPVTGETATFSHNSSGSSRGVKAYEPLGQEISIEDPAGLPDPPPNESVSHWMDMEWQCTQVPAEMWGSFGSMPFHCQMRQHMNPDATVDDFNWKVIQIPVGEDQAAPRPKINHSISDRLLGMKLSSSAKPVGRSGAQGQEGAGCIVPGTNTPGIIVDGQCVYIRGSVNISTREEGGTIDASQTGIAEPLNNEENAALDERIEILVNNKLVGETCKDFLIDKLGKKGYEKLVRTLQNKGIRYSARRSENITVDQAGLLGVNARRVAQINLNNANAPNDKSYWRNVLENLDLPVSKWIRLKANRGIRAIVSRGSDDVYIGIFYVKFDKITTVLHENLHLSTNLGDKDLALKLGLTEDDISKAKGASPAISQLLIDKKCSN